MRESPRIRRLRSDQKALEQLAAESTIFEFSPYGTPPDFYILRFRGRGFWKPDPPANRWCAKNMKCMCGWGLHIRG